MATVPDPFQALGVSRSATDAEVRSAYRRLVQLHHPDHNNGSAESARRFEEVQEAYAEVRRVRAGGSTRSSGRSTRSAGGASRSAGASGTARGSGPSSADDSELGSRLAAMEEELKRARDEALRQARQARRAAARAREREPEPETERPSDEDLGYVYTEDSFGKILSDAAAGLSDRIDHVASEARTSPVTKRFADLIDELGSKLTGEPPDRK
jgi:curved DNA-binding protein CbpA